MAESIYTQLENQSVVTPVNGIDIRHALPKGLFPDDKTFENDALLIAWANENGYTAKLLQKGLQKAIIEVRACFKSCKKDEVWNETLGMKNLASLKWESVNRPNTGNKTSVIEEGLRVALNSTIEMIGEEIPEKTIRKILGKTFDDKTIDRIIELADVAIAETV